VLRQRADDVANELVRRGMGPAAPVAANTSAQGRAKNRRVELWVQPALATAQADGGLGACAAERNWRQ
jgi:hypothetical protein